MWGTEVSLVEVNGGEDIAVSILPSHKIRR